MEKQKIKIGITQGDINGIGYEMIIKALADGSILDICTPIIYGSPKIAAYYRKMLDIQNFNLNVITNIADAHPKKINIINCTNDELKVEIAKSTEEAGTAAISALEYSIKDYKQGAIDALVTAPINREKIDHKKFDFLGHSEYLSAQFENKEALTLMVNGTFRIAILTGHTPIAQIPSLLTEDLIIEKTKILNTILKKDFGIDRPRIAILGLNPHAGENGLIGNEESEIIKPAIKKMNEEGLVCVGPLTADTLFGSGRFTLYDAVLAMYHDQGMIPFKAISMDAGVNYTANLPIIRTAPTHGTEYEIAGQNIASEESFRNAIYLACDIFHHRKLYDEITSNPLPYNKIQ